jgi:hypothetical protein
LHELPVRLCFPSSDVLFSIHAVEHAKTARKPQGAQRSDAIQGTILLSENETIEPENETILVRRTILASETLEHNATSKNVPSLGSWRAGILDDQQVMLFANREQHSSR